MNKTEKLAYLWLTKQLGKTNVKFQHHDSPDFILANESFGYEVKRLYGHTIWFYKAQFDKLKKMVDQVSILVFEDDKTEPNAVIPINLIEDGKVINNIQIKIVLLMQPIKISETNHKKLMQIKLDYNLKSVDEVITKLLVKQNET